MIRRWPLWIFGNAALLMPKPAVSVIIPFFNAEHFLEQAIESVLAQTFHDWELLFDGPTQNVNLRVDGRMILIRHIRFTYIGHIEDGFSS